MPETPKKVGDVVDKAIASINFDWDLQLPRLHGGAAEAAESTCALAKRCSARLRYLSFRIDSESLDTILEDFDTRARQLYAKWTFKPLQDDGTLPRFPVTKSLLARDVKRGRVLGLNKLTKDQRDKLLELLDTALEDDYQLARASDSYQRTSTQPSRAASRSISATRRRSPRHPTSEHSLRSLPYELSHAIAVSNSKPELPPPPPPAKMTRKRPSAEPSSDQPRKRKADESAKQTKLNFARPSSAPTSIRPPTPQARSFNAASSSSSSEVFDTPRQSTTSSADTSILYDDETDSQDLLPSQEATELLEDVALQTSFDAASGTSFSFSTNDIPSKLNATFAVAAARLPPGLSFEYMYELQSLALSWRQEPIDIYKGIQKRSKGRTLTPDERNSEYKQLMRFGNLSTPESFGTRAWIPAADLGKEKRRSIQLNAHLNWASKASDPTLFHVSLKAPGVDRSCRFHRIFGGDRFIALRLPFVTYSDLPSYLRPHGLSIFEHLVKWLVTEHNIAGRQWRAFWVDDKPPKPTKDKPSYNKVYLFATSGIGLSEDAANLACRAMSVGDFINHHAPILDNLHSTDLKLFARFKLGLSKTTPTVVLKQHQFRAVEGIIGDDGKSIMNDGCALMSLALAREISRQLGLNEIPTAIQGRISGAKGLWIVDFSKVERANSNDYWIQVSSSQSKIEPHPVQRRTIDEYRQFEVSSYSTPSQPPALNAQFLTVLKDRGVPKTVLEDCLRDHILPYYAELRNAMTDSCLLRSWMQEHHPIPRDREVELLGAFPDGKNEEIMCLLDAGFNGQDQNSPLRELLSSRLREYLSWWVEKVKIMIKESVFLYCIVDPCGVLEEGEVHLSLSTRWMDPQTGISSSYVDGIDGLVARNPANLPSDIQKIRFVFKQEIEHLRDVLIFSSKGKRSLASLLSGGDYDGDQCWACWHPKIVEKFVNYSGGPPDDLTPESCGLTYRAEKLSTVFTSGVDEQSISAFLEKCIDFNLRSPMVGQCTIEHEKLVYQTNLCNEGAIKLGALAAFLVDARKQGLELNASEYAKIRVKCSGKVKLGTPAYKVPDAEAPSRWKSDNIMDYLRFEVASPQRDEILRDFHQTFPRELHHAPHLAYPWTHALKQSRGAAWQQTLAKLKTDVQAVYATYKLLTVNNKADADVSQYSQAVRECFEKYLSIAPLALPDRQSGFSDKDRQHSDWRVLRASCLYSEVTKTRLTWHLAGDELCFLHSQTLGNSIGITSRMYSTMKIDTKAVKSRFAV
jgi:RNA dependent RNA polymerase